MQAKINRDLSIIYFWTFFSPEENKLKQQNNNKQLQSERMSAVARSLAHAHIIEL